VLHRRFILRQIGRSPGQSLLLVLAVMLAIATLTALSGLSSTVHRMLRLEARRLQAADILVRSSAPFSPPLLAAVERLETRGAAISAMVHEMNVMARRVDEGAATLASAKVVAPGYPFYGEVTLASGRALAEVLAAGRVVVESGLLQRLELTVGDALRVGDTTLTIADVLLSEPDRPLRFFAPGARLLLAAADLEALGLVTAGSRVRYLLLVKVHQPGDEEQLAAELRAASEPERERVDTWRSADSGMRRYFDNLVFFLSLAGAFTLVLAGIGIASTLAALVADKRRTIAILKTVGATGRFVTTQFLVVLLLLGLAGTACGIALGLAIQAALSAALRGVLPVVAEVTLSAAALGSGLLLGLTAVGLFGCLPLLRLHSIAPAAILRLEVPLPRRAGAFHMAALASTVLACWLLRLSLEDAATWIRFLLGLGIGLGCAALAARIGLTALMRLRRGPLLLRQAVRGLARPGGTAVASVTSLTVALTALLSLLLVERELNAAFVNAYPADAPALFFIDIQPHQQERFRALVGAQAPLYPVVRAQVTAVNGNPVDREAERQRRRDNLSRTFNLTYRDHLLGDEILLAGRSLFGDGTTAVPVSVLDTAAGMEAVRPGDTIAFRIAGLPLEATVTSIRRRTRQSLQPFFYFVLPESVIGRAPQTLFSAVSATGERSAELQRRVAAALPNVSAIDASETARTLAALLGKLAVVLRLIAGLAVVAGLLIVVSSVLATGAARMRETVYYTMLGARRRFVLGVFALEHLVLGTMSAVLALGMSQIASGVLIRGVLDLPQRFFVRDSLLAAAGAALLVTLVGLAACWPTLRVRPATVLQVLSEE
jgi:putative ABC transport system permease protein